MLVWLTSALRTCSLCLLDRVFLTSRPRSSQANLSALSHSFHSPLWKTLIALVTIHPSGSSACLPFQIVNFWKVRAGSCEPVCAVPPLDLGAQSTHDQCLLHRERQYHGRDSVAPPSAPAHHSLTHKVLDRRTCSASYHCCLLQPQCP